MLRGIAVLFAVAGTVYLAGLLALFVWQRSLIYPAPEGAQAVPDGYASVILHTEDDLALRAAWRPGHGGRSAIVFFHGNGDTLGGAARAVEALAAAGHPVLLADYRGYSGNPGSPSEKGLYADGRAALDWLETQGFAPGDTVLIGNSIGSGVATQLAGERPVRALVLVSPFTSLPQAASEALPYLPLRGFVRDRFANLEKLPALTMPVLVMHGTADRVIAIAHARQLAGAARRSRFAPIPDVGHELAYLPETGDLIAEWIRATRE